MKSKFALYFLIALFLLIALACQSAGPIGNLFASPTPTVTITPSPTLTPTPTVTPTPVPAGIQLEELPSGNTKVTDYDNGYSLLLSEDWLPISDDEEIFNQALEFAANNNPELSETIKNFETVFADDALRLISFNLDNKYRDKSFFPNVLVLAIKDPIINSVPLEVLIEINLEQLSTDVPYATVVESGTANSKNKVQYGYIYVDSISPVAGRSIEVYQNVLIFKVKDGMVLLTLTSPASKKEVVGDLLQELIDSIELFDTISASNG